MRTLALFLVTALCACSPGDRKGKEAELFITPESFVVDGVAHATPDSAAKAVQEKAPVVLFFASCSAMETKRVLAAIASLQGKHSARVVMSVVAPGVRGCPDFKPTQGTSSAK